MSLLVRGGLVVTMNDRFDVVQGDVSIADRRIAAIASNITAPHDRVIDRVRCSQRVDGNFGFGQRVTHARKRPGTICKKDCKLGGRFDGDLGRWVHGVSKSCWEWLLTTDENLET